jgi:hypothetical protein
MCRSIAGRIGLGLRHRNARHRRQRGSAGGQMQKISAGKFHLNLPSHHSIISSARASSVGATSIPSAAETTTLGRICFDNRGDRGSKVRDPWYGSNGSMRTPAIWSSRRDFQQVQQKHDALGIALNSA